MPARDKRVELGRLRSIGQDRYRDVEPFPAYVAESLEINQAQLEAMKRRLAEESRKLVEERRKFVEERRKLMSMWADYCYGSAATGAVVPLQKARS